MDIGCKTSSIPAASVRKLPLSAYTQSRTEPISWKQATGLKLLVRTGLCSRNERKEVVHRLRKNCEVVLSIHLLRAVSKGACGRYAEMRLLTSVQRLTREVSWAKYYVQRCFLSAGFNPVHTSHVPSVYVWSVVLQRPRVAPVFARTDIAPSAVKTNAFKIVADGTALQVNRR